MTADPAGGAADAAALSALAVARFGEEHAEAIHGQIERIASAVRAVAAYPLPDATPPVTLPAGPYGAVTSK